MCCKTRKSFADSKGAETEVIDTAGRMIKRYSNYNEAEEWATCPAMAL
jgi:hypothetical protein